MIYTTNAVEGYHRQVRKITKTKGVFPNNDGVMIILSCIFHLALLGYLKGKRLSYILEISPICLDKNLLFNQSDSQTVDKPNNDRQPPGLPRLPKNIEQLPADHVAIINQ